MNKNCNNLEKKLGALMSEKNKPLSDGERKVVEEKIINVMLRLKKEKDKQVDNSTKETGKSLKKYLKKLDDKFDWSDKNELEKKLAIILFKKEEILSSEEKKKVDDKIKKIKMKMDNETEEEREERKKQQEEKKKEKIEKAKKFNEDYKQLLQQVNNLSVLNHKLETENQELKQKLNTTN